MFKILLILGFTLFSGCAVKEEVFLKNGKQYGVTESLFRERWWNYVERGVSFSDGNFYSQAIDDFKKAIAQRAEDQWDARTYGMHYTDYFPHRELGIVYYRLSRYEDAKQELETSLGMAKSAKAVFFLNHTRKRILNINKNDLSPPVLRLENPIDAAVTNSLFVELSGLAEDDQYIHSVSVNGKALPIELSRPRYRFKEKVFLREGANTFFVSATDLTEKKTIKSVQIFADHRGPLITISNIEMGNNMIKVKGTVTDESGITSLTINGKTILHTVKKEITIKETVKKYPVTILAIDGAGNKTESVIEQKIRHASQKKLLKIAEVSIPGIYQVLNDSINPGELFWEALNLGQFIDNQPPQISISGLMETGQTFDDQILIEGEVYDDTRIVSIKINNEEFLKKEGKRVFFSFLKSLSPEKNLFVVEALDSAGNKSRKDFTLIRKKQKVRELSSRLSLTVLPLNLKGIKTDTNDSAYGLLLLAFVNQGRFNIVERKRMKEVLEEQKFGASKLIDTETALKLGRVLAAEGILLGTLIKKEHSMEIIAKLVDTETSAVLSRNDVYGEETDLPTLKQLMEKLAYKFKRDLPVQEGRIIDVENKKLTVDLGNNRNLKPHIKLILFREGERIVHPRSGRILGVDTEELGRAVVKKVYPDSLLARVTKIKKKLKAMDLVITK